MKRRLLVGVLRGSFVHHCLSMFYFLLEWGLMCVERSVGFMDAFFELPGPNTQNDLGDLP